MPAVGCRFFAVNNSIPSRGTYPTGAPPVALGATSLRKSQALFKFSGINIHKQRDIYDIKTDLTSPEYKSVAEAQNIGW